MTDQNLLVFGCMVAFITVAGAYVFLREAAARHSLDVETEDAEPSERRIDVPTTS